MQCYTELLAPTGVTHALALPFLNDRSNNLVVVKTSLLQIFSVQSNSSGLQRVETQPNEQTTKLVLEREYPLAGTVTDLCRVKVLNTRSGGEAILISFRNAKLSLIEWDPERRGISTISIHYYERDDLTRSPWVSDLSNCDSILSLDPSSRCAIFNFGVRNLAIIPFHQPGDDLVMGDYDPDIEGHRAESYNLGDVADREKAQQGLIYETPYAPSFVLPLSALDPSILHPINFAFLYEYREPTFGILYSQVATSSALMQERKDIVFYSVFTLDLEQRASTTLLSVSRLPSDLFKVVALPPPVGGALLIGSNELVHVDQAGKTNAVGVNEFSRMVSAFSMTDQSDLALRLENCVVEILDDGSGDLLMVLSTGDFAIVRFRLDGRSVSGISVHLLSTHPGVVSMNSAASSSAYIGEGKVFLGSESSDSVLLGCSFTSSSSRKPRPQSRLAMDDSVDTDEDQSDNEDDLYATSPDLALAVGPLNIEPSSGLRYFHVHDKLINIAPVRDIALGRRSVVTIAKGSRLERDSAELELVAAQGSDSSGGLVVLRRELDPDVLQSFSVESADCLWTASVVHGTQAVSNGSDDNRSQSRCFVIISRRRGIEKEESLVYLEDAGELKAFKAPEFNPNEDTTIDIGTMMGDKRVVQVLKNEVRIYDSDLGLTQIYPIWDDDTNDERVAVNTSFADPCLAILRDDSSILFLQVDDSGDLDEVILNDQLAAKNWVSCSLYYDKTGTFSSVDSASKGLLQGGLYLFLLGQDSRLYIYRFPDQNLVTIIEGLTGQPPILSSEPLRRAGVRESLAEAIVADLGDSASASPYLILRSQNDDINIYKPFVASAGAGTGTSSLRFSKEANTVVPRLPSRVGSELSDTRRYEGQSLRILANLSGLATVFVPGASAGFIVRTSTSLPHFIRLRGSHPRSVSTLNPLSANSSFVFLESNDTINLCKLPAGMLFDHEWPLQKVPLGEQVDHLTYSSSSGTYVLGTCQRATFKLPEDDELHPEWRNEVVSFLPEVHRSSLKIVSPKTWSIIDCHSLDASEYVMAMKNMSLEVSENTHERREMIVVGTAIARGEDIPSRGCIYVFEVIKVVPDPENPAIDRRLKLIGKEVVKGAVTALSEIGGQGFIIVSQGQKCMVRGLKEDGSLLPVAFMDMQCYVSVVKELKGTGMCILGDATKGLWFAGYSEEPYKLSLFAKDLDYLEVVAADFLPDGKRLFIVVADSDCNIHILQYDPEDPKSSNGDRLLSRSKFHTGNMASTLTLLPRTSVSSGLLLAQSDDMDLDHQVSLYQALVTSQNGSIGLITCITEEVYRRLSALQSQLTNTLEHPCGLNPRAFRAVESDGTAGRGMLDGNLLFQWLGLSKQRKTEIASRVGANEWEIKADLQSIGGDGLGYL